MAHLRRHLKRYKSTMTFSICNEAITLCTIGRAENRWSINGVMGNIIRLSKGDADGVRKQKIYSR